MKKPPSQSRGRWAAHRAARRWPTRYAGRAARGHPGGRSPPYPALPAVAPLGSAHAAHPAGAPPGVAPPLPRQAPAGAGAGGRSPGPPPDAVSLLGLPATVPPAASGGRPWPCCTAWHRVLGSRIAAYGLRPSRGSSPAPKSRASSWPLERGIHHVTILISYWYHHCHTHSAVARA